MAGPAERRLNAETFLELQSAVFDQLEAAQILSASIACSVTVLCRVLWRARSRQIMKPYLPHVSMTTPVTGRHSCGTRQKRVFPCAPLITAGACDLRLPKCPQLLSRMCLEGQGLVAWHCHGTLLRAPHLPPSQLTLDK